MARSRSFYEPRRSFVQRVAGPLFGVLALFYLAFHAVSGERGVFVLFRETHRLEALKAELAAVRQQREALETKVHGLSSGSLDLDLLDEQARLVLGLAGKNELIYFLPEPAQK